MLTQTKEFIATKNWTLWTVDEYPADANRSKHFYDQPIMYVLLNMSNLVKPDLKF